jgi:MSHA biogenesis protein MshM
MFGQPEFNRTLALDSVQQLTQRITFDCHLGPLQRDDIEFYVAHRLRIAGFSGGRLFSSAAISRLYATSGGIPRLINIIAHKALMLTYGEGKQQAHWRHVQMAAKDTLASKQLGAQLSKEISKRLTLSPLKVLVMVCASAGVAWIAGK